VLFVHQIDSAGRLVAQRDGPLERPISTCQVGEPVLDRRTMSPHPTATSLASGLYELESGRRLPYGGEGDTRGDTLAIPLG